MGLEEVVASRQLKGLWRENVTMTSGRVSLEITVLSTLVRRELLIAVWKKYIDTFLAW